MGWDPGAGQGGAPAHLSARSLGALLAPEGLSLPDWLPESEALPRSLLSWEEFWELGLLSGSSQPPPACPGWCLTAGGTVTLGGLRLTSVHFPGAPDRETQGKGLGPERGTGLLPGLQLRQQQGKEMGQDGAHPAPREAPGLENAGGSARRQSPGGRQDPPSFPTARFQDAHAAEPGPCFPDRLPGRTNMPHQQPGTGLLPQLQSCFYIGAAGTLSGPHPSNRETGRTGSVCVQPPPGTRVSWVAGAAGFPRGQGSEGVGSERWLIPPPTGVLSSSPSPAPAGPQQVPGSLGPRQRRGSQIPREGPCWVPRAAGPAVGSGSPGVGGPRPAEGVMAGW